MLRLALAVSLCCTFLLSSSGCFDQPDPNCAFLCGGETDDECPDGYSCVAGTTAQDPAWCVRDDLVDDGVAVCAEDSP